MSILYRHFPLYAHAATSHIVKESVVVLLVHPVAYAHHQQRVEQHQPMEPQRWNHKLYNYLAEVGDEKIHRIEKKGVLYNLGIGVQRIEDGRHIHQQLGEDAPKVLNIPEEHEQRREDKPKSDIEADQQPDGVKQKEPAPCKDDAVKNAEQHEHAQRQTKVDKTLYVFGKEEQILGYIHLGKDTGVVHKGAHTLSA